MSAKNAKTPRRKAATAKPATVEPFNPGTVQDIPLDQIEADPEQPRKTFEPAALRELAASLRANGLLQPITVRCVGPGAYQIIAGERRFRAHQLNSAPTIRALVAEPVDLADRRVKQIIENDQRQDVSPLEQARSYQGLMDAAGWNVEELAARIGKPVHRITERTDLLKLNADYQQLLAGGNLKPSEATELARLSPRAQGVLFQAIRAGKCRTYNDLRAMATALVDAEAQTSLLPDDDEQPSETTKRDASTFEDRVARLGALLRESIHDNHIVAVKKTNPHRAAHLADLLAAMQKDLRRIELSLREAAIQADFLAA